MPYKNAKRFTVALNNQDAEKLQISAKEQNTTPYALLKKIVKEEISMKPIYRSFEGKLDLDQRDGFIVSETSTENICLESLHIDMNKRDGKWIFAPTDTYNKDTNWTPQKCLDLISDLFDNKLNILYFSGWDK